MVEVVNETAYHLSPTNLRTIKNPSALGRVLGTQFEWEQIVIVS